MEFSLASHSSSRKSYSDRWIPIIASPEIFAQSSLEVSSPHPQFGKATEEKVKQNVAIKRQDSCSVKPLSLGKSYSPNEVTRLDHQILAGGGTTSTLENIPNRLRASKTKRPVSQKQWIEELTKDNGYLRQELAYYKERLSALLAIHHETTKASTLLEEALEKYSQRELEAEKLLLDYWNIDRDELGEARII